MSLAGKIAVVAGSSRGIGRGIALQFAQAKASLVLLYNSDTVKAEEVKAEALKLGSPKVEIVKFDIGSVASIKTAFAQITKVFPAIDISVINSGVFAPINFDTVTESEYDRIFNINAKGAFFALQESARITRDGGRLIVISSTVTHATLGGAAVYSGSKGALNQFVRQISPELGARKITINAVSPGYTETDMLPEALREIAKNASPFKRIGTSEDIAKAVEFLASDAGAWITGADLNVSGGAIVY